MASSEDKHQTLDPVFAQAVNNKLDAAQKIKGLKEIVHAVNTGMLTSRDKNGLLARARYDAGFSYVFSSF